MDVPWGLIALLFGFLYGAMKPGNQPKGALLRQGIWIGIVVALVLAVIGALAGAPALGITGAFGIIVAAIVMSLLFILGVWIGDLVTGARRRMA